MALENNLTGNVMRHESVVDLVKLKEFQTQHDPHMGRKDPDPAGRGYQVTYINTSIVTQVLIECRCGERKDITDYSNM